MAKRQAKLDAVTTVMKHIEGRGVSADDAARRDWLVHNFQRPLEDLLGKASHNAGWYLAVNIVVIGGGFATSGVAVAAKGNGTADWFVFGIGLLVALAGGLSQQFRFGFRSSESRTLVLAFFNEGWHFAMATGVYAIEAEPAWVQFGERVDALNGRAAAVESIESELPQKSNHCGHDVD